MFYISPLRRRTAFWRAKPGRAGQEASCEQARIVGTCITVVKPQQSETGWTQISSSTFCQQIPRIIVLCHLPSDPHHVAVTPIPLVIPTQAFKGQNNITIFSTAAENIFVNNISSICCISLFFEFATHIWWQYTSMQFRTWANAVCVEKGIDPRTAGRILNHERGNNYHDLGIHPQGSFGTRVGVLR